MGLSEGGQLIKALLEKVFLEIAESRKSDKWKGKFLAHVYYIINNP